MSTEMLIFSLALAGVVFLVALNGLRKKFFSEGYAGIWMFISLSLFVIIVFPGEIKNVSVWLGFQNNTSFLFLLAIISLILITMIQSIHISKLRRQVKDLAQEVGLKTRD